ncbi:MAG: hypothetical protein QY306_12860 [Anaerolineales bacterium]|nr:MAG: hypothetical protein QY306_12860 [Anaerolineales bacterium]
MKPQSHGARMFLLIAALTLVLACAPATGAPVIPASDPNAVQLYIQQTAAAASTQTQAALPPSPTFTSTPRSTFTPEATFTPFQTFVLPSPSFGQTVQYYRVKHDNQLALYNYKSRTVSPDWGYLKQTPEVVPLSPIPKEGTGTHRTPMTGRWETFINELNDNDKKKLNFLKSPSTALFNGAGFPQMESLTMGGNIVTIEAIQGGWGRVHTLDYGSPGSAAVVNYFTEPSFVHKVVIVTWNTKTKTTYWVEPPQGVVYWPFVARNDVWVQMDRLEPFPILPMQVTASLDQEERKEPSLKGEVTRFDLNKGENATIVEYYPSGSSVWGRLQDGYWILLFQYTKDGPTYYTTWSMETLPPLPPPSSE